MSHNKKRLKYYKFNYDYFKFNTIISLNSILNFKSSEFKSTISGKMYFRTSINALNTAQNLVS